MYLRRLSTTIILITMTAVAAMAYSIEEIPNVHLTDKTQYVSNPDGVLRQTTSTVSTEASPTFGSHRRRSSGSGGQLYRRQRHRRLCNGTVPPLGHRKEGQQQRRAGACHTEERKAVIRNGYGAEGILPDIICGRIIRDNMVPHFREGDYDGGMLSAVARIDSLLTPPVLWLSSNQNTRTTRSKKTTMHSTAIWLWQGPQPQSCCSMCFFSHSHRASKAVSTATTVLTKSNYCASAPHSSLSAWHCRH